MRVKRAMLYLMSGDEIWLWYLPCGRKLRVGSLIPGNFVGSLEIPLGIFDTALTLSVGDLFSS